MTINSSSSDNTESAKPLFTKAVLVQAIHLLQGKPVSEDDPYPKVKTLGGLLEMQFGVPNKNDELRPYFDVYALLKNDFIRHIHPAPNLKRIENLLRESVSLRPDMYEELFGLSFVDHKGKLQTPVSVKLFLIIVDVAATMLALITETYRLIYDSVMAELISDKKGSPSAAYHRSAQLVANLTALVCCLVVAVGVGLYMVCQQGKRLAAATQSRFSDALTRLGVLARKGHNDSQTVAQSVPASAAPTSINTP